MKDDIKKIKKKIKKLKKKLKKAKEKIKEQTTRPYQPSTLPRSFHAHDIGRPVSVTSNHDTIMNTWDENDRDEFDLPVGGPCGRW